MSKEPESPKLTDRDRFRLDRTWSDRKIHAHFTERYGLDAKPHQAQFAEDTFHGLIERFASKHFYAKQIADYEKRKEEAPEDIKKAEHEADYNIHLFTYQQFQRLKQPNCGYEGEVTEPPLEKSDAFAFFKSVIGRSIDAFEIVKGAPRITITKTAAMAPPEKYGMHL